MDDYCYLGIMENLTCKIDLNRFLYLLGFDTKLLKTMSYAEVEALRNDYMLVHTVFTSTDGLRFTKMFRSAVIGKCSALNGVLIKRLDQLKSVT